MTGEKEWEGVCNLPLLHECVALTDGFDPLGTPAFVFSETTVMSLV